MAHHESWNLLEDVKSCQFYYIIKLIILLHKQTISCTKSSKYLGITLLFHFTCLHRDHNPSSVVSMLEEDNLSLIPKLSLELQTDNVV